jgi:hypothetical protein
MINPRDPVREAQINERLEQDMIRRWREERAKRTQEEMYPPVSLDLANANSTRVYDYGIENLLYLSLPLGATERVVAELAGLDWPVANIDPSDKALDARRLTLDPRQAPTVDKPDSMQTLTITVTPSGLFGPLMRKVYQVSVTLQPTPRC